MARPRHESVCDVLNNHFLCREGSFQNDASRRPCTPTPLNRNPQTRHSTGKRHPSLRCGYVRRTDEVKDDIPCLVLYNAIGRFGFIDGLTSGGGKCESLLHCGLDLLGLVEREI